MRAILLAAGASRRASGAKALFALGDRTYVERSIDTLREAGADEVVVVLAAPHADAIQARLGARAGVRHVENLHPELGMLASVQVGLAEIPEGSPVVLALVDHPSVRTPTVRRLVHHLDALGADDVIVRPRFAERAGHPIVLGARAWPRVRDDTSARTLRESIARAGRLVDVEVDDPAVLEDRDGPASARDEGLGE